MRCCPGRGLKFRDHQTALKDRAPTGPVVEKVQLKEKKRWVKVVTGKGTASFAAKDLRPFSR